MHNYGIFQQVFKKGTPDIMIIDGYSDPHDPCYLLEKVQVGHPEFTYYIDEVEEEY